MSILRKQLVNFCNPLRTKSDTDATRFCTLQGYVEHYNNVRLNSAIDYITPKDMLLGRQQEIHSGRDRKLAASRQQRQVRRQQARITTADPASFMSVLETGVEAHSPVQKASTHTLIDSEG
jgi:hypothetical protein